MTRSTEWKTAHGISAAALDRLDTAHSVLIEFEDEICAAMKEIGLRSASNSPLHIVEDAQRALTMLISEPVN